MDQENYNASFIFSLVLHVVVIAVLIISFEFRIPIPLIEKSTNAHVINAIAMTAPAAHAPIVHEEPVARPAPQHTQEEAVKIATQLKQKAIAIAIKEKRKQVAIQKALLAKQLLADLQAQTEKENLEKKKLEKLAQLEKLEKLEKLKKFAELKKLEKIQKEKINKLQKIKNQEAIANAMEKELKDQATKALQQQMLAEQARAEGVKIRNDVDKYKALILQAISRRWLVPTGINKSLTSELLIRLAPGGAVLDVQITKSSGDIALDHSARDAVFRASPLPVPADSDAFDQFRQFVLKVKPENVIVNQMG